MPQAALDKHQLAGLDDRERGFSRPIEFEREGEDYRAVLRYESILISTGPAPSQDVALFSLVQSLQSQGYRQLKTQTSFRNGLYLGSQELWVEYPDPPHVEQKPSGVIAKLLSWFRPRATNE